MNDFISSFSASRAEKRIRVRLAEQQKLVDSAKAEGTLSAFKGRRTGKTSSIAFGVISKALANPNQDIKIEDHINHRTNHHRLADIVFRMSPTTYTGYHKKFFTIM